MQPKGELIRLWTAAEIQLIQLCPTRWVPASCCCPARWAFCLPGWVCVSAGNCSQCELQLPAILGALVTVSLSRKQRISCCLWKSLFFPQIPQASKTDFGHLEFPLDSFWSSNLHSFIAAAQWIISQDVRLVSLVLGGRNRANPLLF